MKTKQKQQIYGFYSQEAAELGGTIIYSTSNNKEVEVTALFDSKEIGETNYIWRDKIYVGVVNKYLRKGRDGKFPKYNFGTDTFRDFERKLSVCEMKSLIEEMKESFKTKV